MGIRDMFDHKYPITNLHEIDLTFMHEDIDRMISILEGWEGIIEYLKEGIKTLDDLTARLNVAEADIRQLKIDVIRLKSMKNDLDDLKYQVNIIDSRVKIIEKQLPGIINYIDDKFNYVIKKSYQDDLVIINKLNQAKRQLQSEIDDLYAIVARIRTDLTNPWHWGEVFSPDENNKLIYEDLADVCPTAEEYSKANLTADEYDDFKLTAYEYARFGFKMLHLDFVFSPSYGFRQSIDNVLTSIINYIKGTLTANEYTALDLTADEYTDLNLTASDYYSYNSNQGYIGLGGNGLTAIQYSQLDVLN